MRDRWRRKHGDRAASKLADRARRSCLRHVVESVGVNERCGRRRGGRATAGRPSAPRRYPRRGSPYARLCVSDRLRPSSASPSFPSHREWCKSFWACSFCAGANAASRPITESRGGSSGVWNCWIDDSNGSGNCSIACQSSVRGLVLGRSPRRRFARAHAVVAQRMRASLAGVVVFETFVFSRDRPGSRGCPGSSSRLRKGCVAEDLPCDFALLCQQGESRGECDRYPFATTAPTGSDPSLRRAERGEDRLEP